LKCRRYNKVHTQKLVKPEHRGLLGEARVATATDEERAPLEVRRSWARMIRQVYEVDPLLCPRCGVTMRVVAVIERPAVIRQILDHLAAGRASESASPG
jgi:predicted alpha/beta hydrolase